MKGFIVLKYLFPPMYSNCSDLKKAQWIQGDWHFFQVISMARIPITLNLPPVKLSLYTIATQKLLRGHVMSDLVLFRLFTSIVLGMHSWQPKDFPWATPIMKFWYLWRQFRKNLMPFRHLLLQLDIWAVAVQWVSNSKSPHALLGFKDTRESQSCIVAAGVLDFRLLYVLSRPTAGAHEFDVPISLSCLNSLH